MHYRKKILLALTETFGGEVIATDFQKLLFLFTESQDVRKFDFLPYKFGCFSFQAMADKKNLTKEGYLQDSKNWTLKIRNANFTDTLVKADKDGIKKLKIKFDNSSTQELIRHVYLNYPYFAINSEIASNHLSEKELEIIQQFKPKTNTRSLFTIGYEGKSLESYLNLLIQNNIKVLCDVRKNPISRKYGFSKKTLKNACEAVNIKYIHLPELGIVSEKRKNLKNQKDFDNLFKEYEKTILPNQPSALNHIADLIKDYNRIALTCFEASPNQCHRTNIANKVNEIKNDVPLNHL